MKNVRKIMRGLSTEAVKNVKIDDRSFKNSTEIDLESLIDQSY